MFYPWGKSLHRMVFFRLSSISHTLYFIWTHPRIISHIVLLLSYNSESLFCLPVDFHSDMILLSAIATLLANQGLFMHP